MCVLIILQFNSTEWINNHYGGFGGEFRLLVSKRDTELHNRILHPVFVPLKQQDSVTF